MLDIEQPTRLRAVHDFVDRVGLVGGLVRWLKGTYLAEKRWEYVGLLRRGLETKMGDSEEIFERERVCACGRLMKWLKMKKGPKNRGKI